MQIIKILTCFVIMSALILAIPAVAEDIAGTAQSDPMDMAMERAMQCEMFGTVDVSGDTYSGTYVSFEMSDGVINNYTVGESQIKLLNSFEIANFGFINVDVEGATVKAHGSMGDVYVHNNRASILHFTKASQAGTIVTIHLATGVSASQLGNGSNIALSGPAEAILLVENGTSNINNSIITVYYANVSGALTLRVAQPDIGEYAVKVNEMARNGAIGGEMDVVAMNGEHVEVSECYSEMTCMSIQSAGNNDSLNVRVQAEYAHGMIFRIGTDMETIGAENIERVRAKIDGESMKMVSVSELAQYQNEDRTEAAYCVQSKGMGCEVLVYVPHFSERDITIYSEAQTAISDLMLVGIVTVAVVSVVAVVAYKRKQ